MPSTSRTTTCASPIRGSPVVGHHADQYPSATVACTMRPSTVVTSTAVTRAPTRPYANAAEDPSNVPSPPEPRVSTLSAASVAARRVRSTVPASVNTWDTPGAARQPTAHVPFVLSTNVKSPRCSASRSARPASWAADVGTFGRCTPNFSPFAAARGVAFASTALHCTWAAFTCAVVAAAGVGVHDANADPSGPGHRSAPVLTTPPVLRRQRSHRARPRAHGAARARDHALLVGPRLRRTAACRP